MSRCSCNSTARRMDKLGVRGCVREILPLSKKIRQNAVKLYPWLKWAPVPIGSGAVVLAVTATLIVRAVR